MLLLLLVRAFSVGKGFKSNNYRGLEGYKPCEQPAIKLSVSSVYAEDKRGSYTYLYKKQEAYTDCSCMNATFSTAYRYVKV